MISLSEVRTSVPSPRGVPPPFGPSVSPFHVLIMPLAERRRDDGFFADHLGGGQVFFHEDRRHAKDVADVVKPIANIVGRKVISRMKVDADQVANRIVIFSAIQPADRDSPRVKRPATIFGFEQRNLIHWVN